MKKITLICFILFLTACGDTTKVYTPIDKDAVILAFGANSLLVLPFANVKPTSVPLSIINKTAGKNGIEKSVFPTVSTLNVWRLK